MDLGPIRRDQRGSAAVELRTGLAGRTAALRRGNHSRRLIGVTAFLAVGVHRGGYVVVGRAVGDRIIRIRSCGCSYRSDLRIGAARSGAAINVIRSNIR